MRHEMKKRGVINPIAPANIERLEAFFENNELMMRNFVFPIDISEKQRERAAKELYMKYGIFADKETASAYAVIQEAGEDVFEDEGSFVLMANNHPSLSSEYCRHVIGEVPEMPENIKKAMKPVELHRPVIESAEDLRSILGEL